MTRRAGLDRAAVIEEAIRLVDEDGLEHLSLARLAERLDVKVPSLYNHVDGLAGLKNALTKYCLRELLFHFSHAVMGKARMEAIFALADAVRDYARATPGRYALTLQAPVSTDPEWQELGQQNVEVARAVLTPYALGEEVTIHAIRSLRSIVQGFVSLEMAGAFAIPLDLDTSFHWLLRLYADGLEGIAQPKER